MKRLRFFLNILFVAVILAVAPSVFAKCYDDPVDFAAVTDLGAYIDNSCNCSGAVNHGKYVSCASVKVNDAADFGPLSKECKGKVKSWVAKSMCGRAGHYYCCVTKNGVTKPKWMHDILKCAERGGCVSNFTHATDACFAGTCATTPNYCVYKVTVSNDDNNPIGSIIRLNCNNPCLITQTCVNGSSTLSLATVNIFPDAGCKIAPASSHELSPAWVCS